VTYASDDPEAIEIDADPLDARTYFRVRDLLSGFQEELDLCWAVLGEVYGRHDRLRDLSLALRRVRSNIDDPRSFRKRVDFIPIRASFEVADPEILTLLIDPLYASSVSVGIRELIQNAVDATRELRDYADQAESGRGASTDQQAELQIDVSEDGDRCVLEITDNGIGMTPETVQKYFLRAGACYRTSENWKRIHAPDGQPRVFRTGRFGIGVLAVFLLGDEMEVFTRHVGETEGLKFEATLGAELIELKRWVGPVGTKIRIPLRKVVSDQLRSMFDGPSEVGRFPHGLYLLRWPSIRIRWGDREKRLTTEWPMEKGTLPGDWARVSDTQFDDVHWSYAARPRCLACNGFSLQTDTREFHPFSVYANRAPSVSIFDSRAQLRISLDRTRAVVPPDLVDAVQRSISSDIVAAMLANSLCDPPWLLAGTLVTSLSHEAFGLIQYVFAEEGFTLHLPNQLNACRLHRIITVPDHHSLTAFIPDEGSALMLNVPGPFVVKAKRDAPPLPISGSDHALPSWLSRQLHSPKVEYKRDYSYAALDEAIETYLGTMPLVPYSLTKRKAKFPLAFAELADKISRHATPSNKSAAEAAGG
jgi:hypothetical protein